MNKIRRLSRITFEEWRDRLDMMMIFTMGRKTHSFCEDWKWEQLHAAGCTPGEVVDAIVEEFRSMGLAGLGLEVVN
jgi:hypothetical protein